jgi:hypothetical protein
MREMFHNNLFLSNLEKTAQKFETYLEASSPGSLQAMRGWMQQMRAARTQKANA